MVGPRRFQGSGSQSGQGSGPPPEDENRVLTEEEIGEIMVNAHQNLPTLSPSRLWFNHNAVKRSVRASIVSKMDKFAHSWYAAEESQRVTWWNNFKFRYQYKRKYEGMIFEAYKNMAIDRIPDYIYRQGKGEANWMNDDVRKEYLAWRNSEEFKKKSTSGKKNRASQGEGGKAPGTHTMGRQNMVQYMDKMAKGGITPPSVPELVKQSKTSKKTGGLISRKVRGIFDRFVPTKERLQSSQPDIPVDDNEVYYEAAGGYDKKGRVYGTGGATSLFYDRPARHSSAGETSQYTPGLLSRLSHAYTSQGQRLSEIEEWISSQRTNTQPPETCSQGGLFDGTMHDRFDGEGGSGGGDVTGLV